MIIDFHTHVYPDKIASRTMEALQSHAPQVTAYTNGTVEGLRKSMRQAGIDYSVILPVATRKGQFDTVNRFARQINDTYDDLISFGGIHPDDDDIAGKLQFLRDSGFKGIKIHPDYTGTFIDDERYIAILCECARLGLLVVTHAGVDPAFDVIHCTPQKARAVLERVTAETGRQEPFMIFAHLGGMYVYEDVKKYLLGTNCYIDISCSFRSLMSFCNTDDEEVLHVIRCHGADRILFATDCPWNSQADYMEHFRQMAGLTDKEKEMILHGNAQRLLGL